MARSIDERLSWPHLRFRLSCTGTHACSAVTSSHRGARYISSIASERLFFLFTKGTFYCLKMEDQDDHLVDCVFMETSSLRFLRPRMPSTFHIYQIFRIKDYRPISDFAISLFTAPPQGSRTFHPAFTPLYQVSLKIFLFTLQIDRQVPHPWYKFWSIKPYNVVWLLLSNVLSSF